MSGAAPEKPIRILLVGPERLLVESLQSHLSGNRFEVAGVAFDGNEAAAQAEALSPDVVLLDATQGNLDVVDAARRVSERRPSSQVVVLTDEETELHSGEAQSAGTAAFVRKPAEIEDLVETLELVLTLIVKTSKAQAGS